MDQCKRIHFQSLSKTVTSYWNYTYISSYYANKIKSGKNIMQYRDRVIALFGLALKVLFGV